MSTTPVKPRISAIYIWFTNIIAHKFWAFCSQCERSFNFQEKIVDEEITDLVITHKMQQTATFYEVWFSQ